MKRHYGAGPDWQYAYTYANPPEVGPRPRKHLEFWIPKGRKGGQWVPYHAVPVGNYKTWRKVFAGHSHADRLPHSIASVKGGYATSAEAQCDAYLAWARAKGLATVSVYAPREATGKGWYGAKCAKALCFELRAVDPADIHGPAPTPEVDAEREAA